jgi:hypothetical protein
MVMATKHGKRNKSEQLCLKGMRVYHKEHIWYGEQ